MNILIPNSWLKDYLKTNATPEEFARAMSLTSVSIERIDKVGNDYVYDIEITTNRPDLMSVTGIAKEASAVLPQHGFKAEFISHKYKTIETTQKSPLLNITFEKELINRILAVVMEIDLKPSPKLIQERLELSGIRSINNAVDTTNYIMREVGHPAHVFDYDRLTNHNLLIRRSKRGESIVTLDEKEHILPGNDIVADNGKGEIVDLLGIMGTANSAVTNDTKRIVLFLDNNNRFLLRNTSMNLGIRTEAAILNEKGVDPETINPTIFRGIELLKEIADAKLISPIIDIYPSKPKSKNVNIEFKKINEIIGIEIDKKTIVTILKDLDFDVTVNDKGMTVGVPSSRIDDIDIQEDIIEEVARIYGYHKIPNNLPPTSDQSFYHQSQSEFYWIGKIKEAFKFWGFNETYTYSLVSEELFEGPIQNAVKLKNPLTDDRVYMRNSLIPSLLQVIRNNKERENIRIFEISNIYIKQKGLPNETQNLAFVIKDDKASFYEGKGYCEQIMSLLGVGNYKFKEREEGIRGANIFISDKIVGSVQIDEEISVEIHLSEILKYTSGKKVYIKKSKYPPVIEDIRIQISNHYTFQKIEERLKKVSPLVNDISLLDVYEKKKTFRIKYISFEKNLTNEDISPIRERINKILQDEFKAQIG